jgi:alpha-amylase
MRINGIMFQYFEWFLSDDGSLWNRLKGDAERLKEIGITAVWIPPCIKGTGSNDVGYGAYDLYDLGEFDQKGTVRTKYGTKEELHQAIDALHEQGIGVYADVVLNHKGGGDELQTFTVVEVNPDDKSVGQQFGNFDYLLYNDIDFKHPDVREELKRWLPLYILWRLLWN